MVKIPKRSRQTSPPRIFRQSCWIPTLVSVAFVWAYAVTYFASVPGKSYHSSGSKSHDVPKTTITTSYPDGAPLVFGTLETIVVADRTTEVVYAVPQNPEIITGVALLLHGCSHSALKFFASSKTCPTCIGLSEEMRIARLLLEQQTLAVMAVTSQNRKNGCWADRDMQHVQDALQHLCQNVLPIVSSKKPQVTLAFGASSGGHFAAQLAVRHIVDAAFVGVMGLHAGIVDKYNQLGSKDAKNVGEFSRKQQPPLYIAPMPRDPGTTKAATKAYQTIQEWDPKAPVVLDTTTCASFPVTAAYLNERVPRMTLAMATQIVQVLQEGGHLDSSTGMLLQDPTKSDWRTLLQDKCAKQGCLQNQPLGQGISPLAKGLHRAWAFHEYCSEAILKALAFFQESLGNDVVFYRPT